MKIKHIKFLFRSIWTLGLVTGIRYFNCYLKALNDPTFVEDWADACERHARKLEFFNPDDPIAAASRRWAKVLRDCNRVPICKN